MGNPYMNFGHTHDNYSTTETIIGYWIDGRPIYRRCWQVGGVSLSTTGSYTTANLVTNFPSNVEGLIRLDGYCLWGDSTSTNLLAIPRIWAANAGNLSLDVNGQTIRMRYIVSSTSTLSNMIIVAEYYYKNT